MADSDAAAPATQAAVFTASVAASVGRSSVAVAPDAAPGVSSPDVAASIAGQAGAAATLVVHSPAGGAVPLPPHDGTHADNVISGLALVTLAQATARTYASVSCSSSAARSDVRLWVLILDLHDRRALKVADDFLDLGDYKRFADMILSTMYRHVSPGMAGSIPALILAHADNFLLLLRKVASQFAIDLPQTFASMRNAAAFSDDHS